MTMNQILLKAIKKVKIKMTEIPLDYPSILKQRIAENGMTPKDAVRWLGQHGMKKEKIKESLKDEIGA